MKQDWITKSARDFAARLVFECELMEEGLEVLIFMLDPIIHTEEQPYCWDAECPCHDDAQQYGESVLTPFMDGLLTFSEANALRWGENV